MQIAILVFDQLTALDAIGPYEVLSRLPGSEVVFVAEQAGLVRTDTGRLGLHADATLAEVPRPDVIVVPGGPGQVAQMGPGPVHAWLQAADAASTWTTSVCTGSLILAAAGLLAGRRATSHWLALDQLPPLGALPVAERVVADGKYLTAAGVGRHRHGPDAGRAHRRGRRGAGHPAGHRVRPAAAVPGRLAPDRAPGDHRSAPGPQPVRPARRRLTS